MTWRTMHAADQLRRLAAEDDYTERLQAKARRDAWLAIGCSLVLTAIGMMIAEWLV